MAPVATATTCVVNPYAKRAQNAANMGRQSQQRVSNQHKRKFKQAQRHSSRRPQKGDQLTLDNQVAFNSERDCNICRAKSIQKFMSSHPIPKRAHNVLCTLNKATRGLGELTEQSVASLADNKRYKAVTAPILPKERFSGFNNSKVAVSTFFKARAKTVTAKTATTTMTATMELELTSLSLYKGVEKLVNDADFQAKHKNKFAPLAMLAFASEISEKIIRHKDKEMFYQHFSGIEITVPACDEGNSNPHCHSITGQKLLHIDWERTHGMQVPCPEPTCRGTLKSDRSNFSKNKTLFPIYSLEGGSTWCIVVVLVCHAVTKALNPTKPMSSSIFLHTRQTHIQ